MNAVEFRDLCKTYKTKSENRVALKGLTLDIPEGEIFGFAGPNGAGKSTSIKILVGLVRASSGTVSVFEHPAGSREARALLGFLPEVTLYHEFMEAEELLGVHAALAGVPRAERRSRIQQVLEVVGLWDRRRSRIGEFSKGMKQRFGIAQAILAEPKILVLDELTSGLDPQAQANLLTLLSNLKEQGLTIFFSSHHLAEIEKICDSVAIVHQGTLRASGPLAGLLGESGRCTIRVCGDGEGLDAAVWESHPGATFLCGASAEVAPKILSEALAKGYQLLEYREERQSLEALFHRLTPERERVPA